MDEDEIAALILGTYGLKPNDIGAAPVPMRVRLWRAVTRAYRRGKAVDWRSYNAAEAEARAAEQAYVVSLPIRLAEARAEVTFAPSDLMPEVMSFEWVTDEQ